MNVIISLCDCYKYLSTLKSCPLPIKEIQLSKYFSHGKRAFIFSYLPPDPPPPVHGPSFWKFNSTLVNDSNYRDLLDENIKNWLEEFKEVVDKRVLWDLLNIKFDS